MDFIEQYFVDPIKYGTGYNIYNTKIMIKLRSD